MQSQRRRPSYFTWIGVGQNWFRRHFLLVRLKRVMLLVGGLAFSID
jgi:hypothetical protein